jgi:hypothetical protein
MKKILFLLSIAWAICSPNALCAHDVEPDFGFKIAEQGSTFVVPQSNRENVFFDICIEEFSDDDSNDSERKKLSSGRASNHNTAFFALNYSKNYFKKIIPANLFFPRRTPLFIFICVFRL